MHGLCVATLKQNRSRLLATRSGTSQ